MDRRVTIGLTRVLTLGDHGADVEAVRRACLRYLPDDAAAWHRYQSQTLEQRRSYGVGIVALVKRVQTAAHLTVDGDAGPMLNRTLRQAGAYDAFADQLLRDYASAHPRLVEPKQGWTSLVPELWRYYSRGRDMGFTDLGTYNPRSKLPSGKPSDHATSRKDGRIRQPACAYDLGFTPATGYANLAARAYFASLVGKPNVNYVICGNTIWSTESGIHPYTHGGHEGHVHVSGFRR